MLLDAVPDKSPILTKSIDKDLYHAFTKVDIQRVYTTLTIDDFDTYTSHIQPFGKVHLLFCP